MLVLFTDGLIEVRGTDGRELGLDGFVKIAQRSIRTGVTLAEGHEAIISAIGTDGPQGYDQSLVLVRVA